jgi:hypothetical protein
MIGKWTLAVKTPFGEEKYNLAIDAVSPFLSGKIWTDMGSASFENGKYDNENVEIDFSVDTPQKAQISIRGVHKESIITGTIQVDEYPTLNFKADYNNVNI